jgi:GT2 family glycosyltransferase
MKAMNGDYLFLLNTDLILYPKIIEQLLAYLESDDQIAVCGPRLYNRDMTVQLSAQKYHTFFSVFWEIIGIAKRMPTSRIFGYAPYFKNEIKHPTEVEYISGAFMAISKRANNKVGLFDENFFLYTQEVDFCLRCKMHGLKVYYYPDVSAIHLQGETSKQLSFKSDYWLWKDRLFYFQKYYGKFYAISCKFMIRAIMFIKYSITKVQMLGKSKQISNKQKNYEYIFRNL